MSRKLTITLDDEIYKKLYEMIGRGKISPFIEALVRPQIMQKEDLEPAYRQMARDEIREAEALEWAEATNGKKNKAMADQLTTVSKARLINCEGTLSTADLKKVEQAVKVQLGL